MAAKNSQLLSKYAQTGSFLSLTLLSGVQTLALWASNEYMLQTLQYNIQTRPKTQSVNFWWPPLFFNCYDVFCIEPLSGSSVPNFSAIRKTSGVSYLIKLYIKIFGTGML